MRAGANPLAVQAYRNALIHDDSTASRLRDLGVALYYEGSVPEAFDVLQASYERDSTDATTLRVYGYAASENGQMPLAFDLLAMAADAMGREPLADLYERIARLHSEDLNDETALEYVELAERLMPERLTLILNRAIVLQQGGRSREALAAYREYLERAPEAPERLRLAAESRIAMLERVEEMREMARQRRIQEDLRRRLNE